MAARRRPNIAPVVLYAPPGTQLTVTSVFVATTVFRGESIMAERRTFTAQFAAQCEVAAVGDAQPAGSPVTRRRAGQERQSGDGITEATGCGAVMSAALQS